MKTILFFLLLLSPLVLRAESDDEVNARRVALEVAGAFSNDGFKLRDGNWSGSFVGNETHCVQVNLFAGNEYWFTVGATEKAKKISVTIYDENGKPMETEPYEDASKAAAGFSPEISGPYYIKVTKVEGDPAAFCMIYSYK